MKKESKYGSLGELTNGRQRLLQAVDNPDLEERKKQAIQKSPKLRPHDWVTDEEFPHTWIQFKKGANKQQALQRFKEMHSRLPIGELMKPMKLTNL